MASMCGGRLKYLRNFFTMLEMGKWINYLTNGLKMWKMTQRFGKWPKYLGNGLDPCDTALVFEKRLYYVGNGLRI